MEAFVGATGVNVFPNIVDESGDVWREYQVSSQPAFVLISSDGTSESFGSLGEDALQGHIDRLFT